MSVLVLAASTEVKMIISSHEKLKLVTLYNIYQAIRSLRI